MKYALGCFKDKEDKRDFIFKPTMAVKFPNNFMLERTEIKNQGSINSCVAHSISTIKEIQEFFETGKKLSFSVGWVYGYRVGNQYKGQGMYPREALNNLVKYGDVLQTDFPENLEYTELQKLINKRKAKCLSNGKNYRCQAYARVKSTNDVKACLYNNYSPVMIICDIYDSFYETGKNGIVPLKKGNDCGSHAMTIVGWRKINNSEYWIVQNSWGTEWADNGYCYIKIGANFITDLYTVTDMKNVK